MKQNEEVKTKYYENGNQMYEYHVVGNTLNGKQTVWYENGNKYFEGYYRTGAPIGIWRVYWESGAERFTVNLPKREVTINGVVTKECCVDSVCGTKDEGLIYASESDTYFIETMEDLIHSDDNYSWTCPVEIRERLSDVTTSDFQEVEIFE